MHILVIDGQGGGIGRQLIDMLRPQIEKGKHTISAVGTNTLATAAMMKSGADAGATGENAVCVMAARADIIAGPIGILLADAMMGEMTEKMAAAVARSAAQKVVVPVGRCGVHVAGAGTATLQEAAGYAAAEILRLLQEKTK